MVAFAGANRGLFRRGLLIIFVPIVFEIVFVAILAGLVHDAERDILAHQRLLVLTTRCHDLMEIFAQAGINLHLYGLSHDASLLGRYRSKIAEAQTELNLLSRQANESAQDKLALGPVRYACEKAVREFDMLAQDLSIGAGTRIRGTVRQSVGAQLIKEIDKFVQERQQVLEEATAQAARSRAAVVSFLYAGAALAVFLALGLVVFFASTTVSRLDLLVENTRRLAQGKPLKPNVAGTDEIGELDRAFHEMARGLAQAEIEKSEVVQLVSSDLQNPLNAISLAMGSLASGVFGDLPEAALKEIEKCKFNAGRLLNMIEDLLNTDKISVGTLTISTVEVNLDDLLEHAASAVEAYAAHRKIQISIVRCGLTVQGDGERLLQVLVNLLSNAIKYSPPSSTVEIGSSLAGKKATIWVKDRGPGVPPQLVSTIFERFRQAGNDDAIKERSSGLGLAICKSIVEAHGGAIGVESKEGEGSKFWFSIPQAPNV